MVLKRRSQVCVLNSARKDKNGKSRNMLVCLRHFHIACTYFSEETHVARISTNLTPGERADVYETERITTFLFWACFQKFAEFSGSRNDSPALLLLDWYGSHTKSLQLNNIARERA
jgi:hypothetical protein